MVVNWNNGFVDIRYVIKKLLDNIVKFCWCGVFYCVGDIYCGSVGINGWFNYFV